MTDQRAAAEAKAREDAIRAVDNAMCATQIALAEEDQQAFADNILPVLAERDAQVARLTEQLALLEGHDDERCVERARYETSVTYGIGQCNRADEAEGQVSRLTEERDAANRRAAGKALREAGDAWTRVLQRAEKAEAECARLTEENEKLRWDMVTLAQNMHARELDGYREREAEAERLRAELAKQQIETSVRDSTITALRAELAQVKGEVERKDEALTLIAGATKGPFVTNGYVILETVANVHSVASAALSPVAPCSACEGTPQSHAAGTPCPRAIAPAETPKPREFSSKLGALAQRVIDASYLPVDKEAAIRAIADDIMAFGNAYDQSLTVREAPHASEPKLEAALWIPHARKRCEHDPQNECTPFCFESKPEAPTPTKEEP